MKEINLPGMILPHESIGGAFDFVAVDAKSFSKPFGKNGLAAAKVAGQANESGDFDPPAKVAGQALCFFFGMGQVGGQIGIINDNLLIYSYLSALALRVRARF